MNRANTAVPQGNGQPKLADLLAGLNLSQLPSEYEVVEVMVERHPKTDELTLAPSYLDKDRHACGFSSMRFYKPANPGKMKCVGQRFHARVLKVYMTKRMNRYGSIIVHVNVELL